jgi:predicted dehydrogenase
VRGYLNHPVAEVAGLCEADPDILARRAAEHTRVQAPRDFQDLLRLDLDLIEILTPHPLHEAMTVAALADGSPVSVQKPMAMTCPNAIE